MRDLGLAPRVLLWVGDSFRWTGGGIPFAWTKKLNEKSETLTRKQFVERHHLDARFTLTVIVIVIGSVPSVPRGRRRNRRYDDTAIPPIDDTPQQFVQPSLASQDIERRNEVRDRSEGEVGGFVAPVPVAVAVPTIRGRE